MSGNARIAVFVMVACFLVGPFVPSNHGQTIADVARKERERRAAIEGAPPATKNPPSSTTQRKAPPASRNTAGFQDCGQDMKCFLAALNSRKPAFVTEKVNLFDSEEVVFYHQITDFKQDTVVFYSRVEDARIGKDQIGNDETCLYTIPKLNTGLRDALESEDKFTAALEMSALAESCSGPGSESPAKDGSRSAPAPSDRSSTDLDPSPQRNVVVR